jgi:hypothetical protein
VFRPFRRANPGFTRAKPGFTRTENPEVWRTADSSLLRRRLLSPSQLEFKPINARTVLVTASYQNNCASVQPGRGVAQPSQFRSARP